MSASEETLRLLTSIDNSLKYLVSQAKAAAPKRIADDKDLDGQYGNPKVTFMPRDWSGESFKGCKFSECPAALLDLIAGALDYFGDRAERDNELTTSGKPAATFKRLDAARARGWAKRVREGKVPAASAPAGGGVGSDWALPEDPMDGGDDDPFLRSEWTQGG